jgi:c-di-GMP-binding flagellar brake protein YcgR
VRFVPGRVLPEGSIVQLRMVLPPFIVVEARGEVTQMRSETHAEPSDTVIVRFTDIAEEDREKIIRYVVQRQAELQRRHQRSLS